MPSDNTLLSQNSKLPFFHFLKTPFKKIVFKRSSNLYAKKLYIDNYYFMNNITIFIAINNIYMRLKLISKSIFEYQ